MAITSIDVYDWPGGPARWAPAKHKKTQGYLSLVVHQRANIAISILAATPTGQGVSRIKVERRFPDYHVSLIDSPAGGLHNKGTHSAISIEFGRYVKNPSRAVLALHGAFGIAPKKGK